MKTKYDQISDLFLKIIKYSDFYFIIIFIYLFFKF